MKRELLLVVMMVGALSVVSPLGAQEGGASQEPEGPTLSPDEIAKAEEEGKVRIKEEVTVVSATRTEERLVDAPATLSVISADDLETTPAQNFGDVLRAVPGMNAVQTSARDINLTARQATSTLATAQLVAVDGRSVYLDFFNLVLWDFVPPANSNEIAQIEVVRGPASVVWGANALTGVVNIITKSPRDNEGFGFNVGAGLINRDGGSREADGNGYSYDGNFSYSTAFNDSWSMRVSAGYLSADPFSRPTGTVPLSCHPLGVEPCRDANGEALPGGFPLGGAPYPGDSEGLGNQWVNTGTSQPKFDLRLDQEVSGGGRITYQGGYSGTEGIIHTGIGPFDILRDANMAYGKVVYQKGALRVGAFGNFVDVPNAPNLLQVDPDTLAPVELAFKTQTYDVEFSNTSVLGGRHALTYGGNYRRNNFDITLAPSGDDRNELGAYVQEEFFLDRFRLAAGVRVDKFGNLDKAVWSPRVSVMFKPTPDQSIRVSYNRAFRSPSYINNFLDQDISNPDPVDLRPLAPFLPPPIGGLIPNEPFFLTVNNFGNGALKEEHIDAFEIAYTATFGNTSLNLAVYQNDTDDNINFTVLLPDQENPQGLPGLEFYSPENPARGVGAQTSQPITLDPFLMGALGQVPPPFGPVVLPWKVATYLNLGPLRNRGFEAGIQHRVNPEVSFFANYSWQDTPEVLDAAADQIRYPISEVGIPAAHRFNAGVAYNGPRFLGNVNVNYSGEALWTDVLGAEFHGFTDAYTMLNATVGVRLADGRITLSLKGTNLTNERILQHIYGDLIRRSVRAELSFFTR
jgi:outer membrane receptor protein involved in Fe transport